MRWAWQKEKEKAGEEGVVIKKTDPWLAIEHISQYALGLSCRYRPGPVAGKAVNFQIQHSSPLQSHNPSAEDQDEEGLLTDPAEKRFVPHLSALLQQKYADYGLPPAQEQTSRSLSPTSTTKSRLQGENSAEPCNHSRRLGLSRLSPSSSHVQSCPPAAGTYWQVQGHTPGTPAGNTVFHPALGIHPYGC